MTNNGQLSTATLRGMRDLPLESFERIRVLDLHVHLAKGELGPKGMAEKNVFDILQGAAIRHPISPGSGFFLARPNLRLRDLKSAMRKT